MNGVSLPIFYLIYAKVKGWSVPKFHIEVCEWLEDYGSLGLLMLPRGHGKSSLLEVYNAYKIYRDNEHTILHQGATDSDAYKISRGTVAVLENHPLTKKGCIRDRGEIQRWWVAACTDVKHGNIHARGILSNVTGSRAHEIQNDDVEVPNTTSSQDLRDKLSYRLSEQIHILIPGGTRLFVGTPHSHDSLYDKLQEAGANTFIRPMYTYSKRLEGVKKGVVYSLDCGSTETYDVFAGLGSQTYTPKYLIIDNHIIFKEDHNLIDIYHGALWPERFTYQVMLQRRKECTNLNEWDSQYMLASKPIGSSPLDLDKFLVYKDDIVFNKANMNTTAHLGLISKGKLMVSVTACWDPSSGKQGRDASAFSVVFKDTAGKLYWHSCTKVQGDLAITEENGRIIGGQVWEVCDIIDKYKLPCVYIEINGIGGHIPSILKAALKTRGISCGVIEINSTENKNKRIMNIQAYLLSNSLNMHETIKSNIEVTKQINNFSPNTTKNKDDYLDSLAHCIMNTPSTLGHIDINKITKSNGYMNTGAVVARGF